jgi:hypothetical protein
LNFGFNDRCQFQLKHHQLGKNEKSTTVLSPLLVMSRGFFVARIKNGRVELLLGLYRKSLGGAATPPCQKNIL